MEDGSRGPRRLYRSWASSDLRRQWRLYLKRLEDHFPGPSFDLHRQQRLYLRRLEYCFPWAPSDRLAVASQYVVDVMNSAPVQGSTRFTEEMMESAEESGRRLAEMLGKAPAVGQKAQGAAKEAQAADPRQARLRQ